MSVINVKVDLFNIELIENMGKILHLNLKKKWFDMIVSGEKKEEYREITGYWVQRLLLDMNGNKYSLKEAEKAAQSILHFIRDNKWDIHPDSIIKYDKIHFRNGYSKQAPVYKCNYWGLSVGLGRIELGAPRYPVFIIKLDNND